ncbi:MAG: sigma-70 family RNA polymerase sigma factor [Actinomycetota bacterium]|nr:sigma-70 family RNA polymerase sigma factor [Actinomycetota bacterium]
MIDRKQPDRVAGSATDEGEAGEFEGSRTAVTEGCQAGVGDLGELYATLARRLEQIVRVDVRAPEPVIEEACQFAWSRLAYHRDRVRRDAALTWLAKTAIHEAFKLIRRDARELSLDATLEEAGEPPCRTSGSTPQALAEQRERLAGVRRLPERQQRLVWLHALGLSYAEMAAHEGYTPRTVERQLLRARNALRAAEM